MTAKTGVKSTKKMGLQWRIWRSESGHLSLPKRGNLVCNFAQQGNFDDHIQWEDFTLDTSQGPLHFVAEPQVLSYLQDALKRQCCFDKSVSAGFVQRSAFSRSTYPQLHHVTPSLVLSGGLHGLLLEQAQRRKAIHRQRLGPARGETSGHCVSSGTLSF